MQFQSKVSALAGTMHAAENFASGLLQQVVLIRQTLNNAPGTPEELIAKASDISRQLEDVMFTFEGPRAKASREEIPPHHMSLNSRLSALVYTHYSSTSGVTGTETDNYEVLREELQPVLEKLNNLQADIRVLNDALDKLGAPWTPGRLPNWEE